METFDRALPGDIINIVFEIMLHYYRCVMYYHLSLMFVLSLEGDLNFLAPVPYGQPATAYGSLHSHQGTAFYGIRCQEGNRCDVYVNVR